MVTAGTYEKQRFYSDGLRLQQLQRGLLAYARKYEWQLEAWAVFPNHYHFIGLTPSSDPDASSLRRFLGHFHSRSAAWLNRLERTPGRPVWHNFWESHLSYERSYLARLNYVHQNAVHHGLARVPDQYPYCSAAWFQRTASEATIRTIYGFPIDRLNVADDF